MHKYIYWTSSLNDGTNEFMLDYWWLKLNKITALENIYGGIFIATGGSNEFFCKIEKKSQLYG